MKPAKTIYPVDVHRTGAVILGPDIVCDGFVRDRLARVQTHIHTDHLAGFESSKGVQDIVLSPATRALLCAELNADLPYRTNLKAVECEQPLRVGGSMVSLYSSGHMLGAVQVQVELPGGLRVGYSGDFAWPLERVIEVDALVVDSTYGKPTSIRKYSQSDCEDELVSLVSQRVSHGPVYLTAHRGTLHRALSVLSGAVRYPVIGSKMVQREVEVFRLFGYAIDELLTDGTAEAAAAIGEGRYIRVFGPKDKWPIDPPAGVTVVRISAFFSQPDQAVVEFSNRAYAVALSDHADFNGTLAYIHATGAKYVVTDNTRGFGVDLALAIKSRLGVEAEPSSNLDNPNWGA